jgi:hypothetical protein
MGSVAEGHCARGERCSQYGILGEPAKPSRYNKSGLCGSCLRKHAGGLPTDAGWIAKGLEAMFPGEAGRSLWDLLDLDPRNGGRGKRSDRDEALHRLDARTLKNLRRWLEEEHAEEAIKEAINRVGPGRIGGLWADVCLHATLRAQPPGATGRVVDMLLPAKLELLDQQPGVVSGRDLERRTGVPRETLRRRLARMQEIGFSVDKPFTTDDLAYIMFGKRRGRPPS